MKHLKCLIPNPQSHKPHLIGNCTSHYTYTLKLIYLLYNISDTSHTISHVTRICYLKYFIISHAPHKEYHM